MAAVERTTRRRAPTTARDLSSGRNHLFGLLETVAPAAALRCSKRLDPALCPLGNGPGHISLPPNRTSRSAALHRGEGIRRRRRKISSRLPTSGRSNILKPQAPRLVQAEARCAAGGFPPVTTIGCDYTLVPSARPSASTRRATPAEIAALRRPWRGGATRKTTTRRLVEYYDSEIDAETRIEVEAEPAAAPARRPATAAWPPRDRAVRPAMTANGPRLRPTAGGVAGGAGARWAEGVAA